MNETVVESIPPFKTPPSSLTVILITDVPYLFSIGINANCSGEDSNILISENNSLLSAFAVIVIFCGLTSPPYEIPLRVILSSVSSKNSTLLGVSIVGG